MNQKLQSNSFQQTLLKVDLCVACGMCLPHCPTYQVSQTESESPRGRLSLISALLKSDIQPDTNLLAHLDHCLVCRSCESCCPASVPFADIMDETRGYLKTIKSPTGFFKKALLELINHKKTLRYLVATLNFTGIRKLLSWISFDRLSKLGNYNYFLGQLRYSKRRNTVYRAKIKGRHSVALFTGCVHEYFDKTSLDNAIKVLNHFGVDVYVPKQQSCCGAMYLHNGQLEQAALLAENNRQTFSDLKIEAVVSLASACTVTLMEAEKKQTGDSIKYIDVISYLDSLEWDETAELSRIDEKIVLHFPCTQRNVLKNTAATERVLGRIPGLVVGKQLDSVKCCGAAGTYTLDFPERSGQLKTIANTCLENEVFDMLVTSNIGCAMQFKSMQANGANMIVLHPVDLIARALPEI